MAGVFADSEFHLCDTCEKVYLVVRDKPHVCGQTSNKGHGESGAFNSCLKKYYFPFLLKFGLNGINVPKTKCTPRFVLPWLGVFWLILFGVSAGFGPGFLNNTRSGLDVPAGTPTAAALDVMNANYPEASRWPPAIVLHHVKPGVPGFIMQKNTTRLVSDALKRFQAAHIDTVTSISGYFEMMDVNLPVLANLTLSEDGRSMITTISMRKEAELKQVTHMVTELLELVHTLEYHDIKVGLTGIFPLFGEMQEATEQNFAMIDGIALPLCIIILGFNLKSYKHMVIALINLGVSLMLSFTLLLPISEAIDINPFSPSIMMSLGIAVCFDYSLFMLNRFREAVILEGLDTNEAVYSALETAGHVVVLSGSTLLATFLLLLIFPQNFLQSVGWACSSVILSAIIINMSITPLLLLSCKCLTTFEALPGWCAPVQRINWLGCCKRRGHAEKRSIPLDDIVTPSAGDAATSSSSPDTTTTAATTTTTSTSSPDTSSSSSPPDASSSSSDNTSLNATQKPAPTSSADTPAASSSTSTVATTASASSVERKVNPEPMQRVGRSNWFKVSYGVTKHPWLAFFIAACATAGFAERWSNLLVTSDDGILFLQGSSTLTTLEEMRQNFDEGMLDPFSMVVTTTSGANNSVLTPEYFAAENAVLNVILSTQSQYVSASSFTALSFFAGQNVTFQQSLAFLTPGSPTYNSSAGSGYRLSAGSMMNFRRSASLVRISTIVHPKSQKIVPFIDDVRAQLSQLNGPINAHLFGAYSSDYDVQNSLYALTPYLYASTIFIVLAIVGASFQSVMIAMRLAITVVMSLAWTYGLMAMVFQPSPTQTAFAVIGPSLIHSSGVYWIIPIMSFSILVGLALDYDIFLMSRVMEFRRLGWSDRASICLAIEKTGGIITAAGVIMAISFAGLMFPNTIVLNQYGFSLCIGVTLDTFVVRTILVPAVFTAFGGNAKVNWWPGKMPPPMLSPEAEAAALHAGYWRPPEKWPIEN